MKVTFKVLLSTVLLFFVFGICASAQDGAQNAFSPYSIYGIGTLYKEGTATTKSMGGIGIATRNRRFINTTNPAAITARDSLSFMCDFGVTENNQIFSQTSDGSKLTSANNTFNISNFVMTFPIWRSSAFMIGITPFSDVGYDFTRIETNQDLIGVTNNITYQAYGQGGTYQLFAGAAATFWKRLSLGAEFIYYFGTMDKVSNNIFSDSSYRHVNNGYVLQVNGFTGKFGLQYEQPIAGRYALTLGATYRMAAKMKGNVDSYSYAVASELSDTVATRTFQTSLNGNELKFADEIGVGISFKAGENWSLEFNYLRSDWTTSGFENFYATSVEGSSSTFKSSVGQSFRAGFEFTPNRSDVRYYMKRVTYRGGLYYDEEPYTLDPNNRKVSTVGLTLGMTLPVFSWYNLYTIAVEINKRCSFTDRSMVGEHYVTFYASMSIHDIWFMKNQYK